MPTPSLSPNLENGPQSHAGPSVDSHGLRSISQCPQEEQRLRVEDTLYSARADPPHHSNVIAHPERGTATIGDSLRLLATHTRLGEVLGDTRGLEQENNMAPSANPEPLAQSDQRIDLLRKLEALFQNADRALHPELEHKQVDFLLAFERLLYADEVPDALPADGPWQELLHYAYWLARPRPNNPAIPRHIPQNWLAPMRRTDYIDCFSLILTPLAQGQTLPTHVNWITPIRRPARELPVTTGSAETAHISAIDGHGRNGLHAHSGAREDEHDGHAASASNVHHEEANADETMSQDELGSAGQALSRINFSSEDGPALDDTAAKDSRFGGSRQSYLPVFLHTASSSPLRSDTPNSMQDGDRDGAGDLKIPESAESSRPISSCQPTRDYPGRITSIPKSLGRYTPTLLAPGNEFTGHQKSDKQVYNVHVEIKHVNMDQSLLCGYLRIEGLTEDHPTLTTYFEGEVIGSKYSFTTRHPDWGSSASQDMLHWNKFPAWKPLAKAARAPGFTFKNFSEREHIFMRWKEYFLVPDHRVKSISGASFEGFYYICFNQRHGTFDGIYYHSKSEKFQHLTLKHKGRATGCIPAIELR